MADGSLFLAIYTDRVECDKWSPNTGIDETGLLEVRIFNDKSEWRAWRPDIRADFRTRVITDTDPLPPHYDETHYLEISGTPEEIDTAVQYHTYSGTAYTLPGRYDRVLVRNYIVEGLNGLTYAGDWRIVRFLPPERGGINALSDR